MNGINKLFASELRCVNIGVEVFYRAILEQNVTCVQVDWKPPADGDPRLIRILEWLEG